MNRRAFLATTIGALVAAVAPKAPAVVTVEGIDLGALVVASDALLRDSAVDIEALFTKGLLTPNEARSYLTIDGDCD